MVVDTRDGMIDASHPYRSLRFKRGYFATTGGDLPQLDASWRGWSSGDLRISHDPDLPFAACANDGRLQVMVAIVGLVVSLDVTSTDPEAIVAFLHARLLESEDAFHTAMDACCGRFVCFYSSGAGVHVVGDATCMKMICFTTEPIVAIASHAALLAEVFAKPESAEAIEFWEASGASSYNMSFLPGFATAFDGIRLLAPNTCLALDTGTIRRVFPRGAIEGMPFERALEQVCDYLQDLAGKFAALGPLAISLTAGLDSRITAAAFSKLADRVSFFTYVRRGDRVNAVDAIVASRVAKANGLAHQKLSWTHEITASDNHHADYLKFAEVARCNTRFEHFYSLAYAYVANHPPALHVRSNIGEIGRARYHTAPFTELLRDAPTEVEKLARIYCQWTRARPHEFIHAEFSRYLKETDLIASSHRFDLLALYYWELLMPVWHGALLLESDMAYDTVSLFNCRRVLTTYLAMPFDRQVSRDSMVGCVEHMCPTMLREPFNPKAEQLTADELAPYLNVETGPITVTAIRQADGKVVARVSVADGVLTGDVEYAFYLLKGSERIATQWYGKQCEFVFDPQDLTAKDPLDVTGFAREVSNPENKYFKRVSVRTAD